MLRRDHGLSNINASYWGGAPRRQCSTRCSGATTAYQISMATHWGAHPWRRNPTRRPGATTAYQISFADAGGPPPRTQDPASRSGATTAYKLSMSPIGGCTQTAVPNQALRCDHGLSNTNASYWGGRPQTHKFQSHTRLCPVLPGLTWFRIDQVLGSKEHPSHAPTSQYIVRTASGTNSLKVLQLLLLQQQLLLQMLWLS